MPEERQYAPPVRGMLLGGGNGRRAFRGGTMGEFIDALMSRQIATPSTALDQLGPLAAPVSPAGLTQEQLLQAIYEKLRDLPSDLLMAARYNLPLTPRECVPILTGVLNVSALASVATSIHSYTMPDGFTGFLERIGLAAAPETALANLTWRMKINGNVHPGFSNFVAPVNNLISLWPCYVELSRGKKIEIEAVNAAAIAIPVSVVFQGFQEVITDAKPYGSTSLNGVA
jgi:hypothetical protein